MHASAILKKNDAVMQIKQFITYLQDKESCGNSWWKPVHFCQIKQAVAGANKSIGLPAEMCYRVWITSLKHHKYNKYQTQKYIATISQVLSLKETEVDWLARHFGHNIQVHRDFYRLHESTSEIAKVSKLLLTIDQGETKKIAGKSLAEIDLNG